jgi:hypothetical protein
MPVLASSMCVVGPTVIDRNFRASLNADRVSDSSSQGILWDKRTIELNVSQAIRVVVNV